MKHSTILEPLRSSINVRAHPRYFTNLIYAHHINSKIMMTNEKSSEQKTSGNIELDQCFGSLSFKIEHKFNRKMKTGMFFLIAVVILIHPLLYGQSLVNSGTYLTEGYIQADENIKLHYRITGSGKDTVVVVDVGWLYHYIEKQKPEQTYITYDVRDRGYSDAVENTDLISIEHEIEDLEKIRKHFNIDKLNLIGWSYLGGVVALYASRYPDHVKSIVQIGPIPLRKGDYWDSFVQDRMSRRDAVLDNRLAAMRSGRFDKNNPESYCREYWKAAVASAIADISRIDEYTENIPCDCPNEYPENLSIGIIISKLDEWDWSAQIKNIKAPALIIHGIKDNIPIESSLEWAKLIPNGKLLLFDSSGHFPMAEEHTRFFKELTGFFVANNRRILWNETLMSSKGFNRGFNSFLQKAIKDLPPGKALDVAMGEGRNTILLARYGWETTGFDIADVAMDSAKVRAAREGLVINTVVASKEEFDFGTDTWDLITVIYSDIICGGCCAKDPTLIDSIKKSLKPGGRIVYEWFTKEGLMKLNPKIKIDGPGGCHDNAIREAFLNTGGFKILHYSEELGIPDWDPSQKFDPVKLIYFIGEKL
jgi:pimeloyl-ACP methyl ester carboxylesterase/SAM-dependent methyltransferase